MTASLRQCLREPIPEIFQAAEYLNKAVTAHLKNNRKSAEQFIRDADIVAIRDWTESLWGKDSPYIKLHSVPAVESMGEKVSARMPNTAEKHSLHERDGYHCRFCGIPVIRREVRARIKEAYPEALRWGSRNSDQHTAFQAMWAQYDHLLPHAKGGTNDLTNLVVTCAPCNFARMNYTLTEVGLANPLERVPVTSDWDGLERFK